MFDSPIKIITNRIRTEIEGQVLRAVQNVGVIVDKEELLKALQYDRDQYSKGYADGYEKAIEEFSEMLKHRCYMSNESCGMNYLMPWEIDEIAKKMIGESE